MNKIETFNEFLTLSNSTQLPLMDLITNLIIGIFLAFLIQYTYIRCGNSVSNRKNLAKNFPLLLLTTIFVISIVKSSLALSLGLVGALSIVRFRTAVKEPIELLYLFLCIAAGLGLGANQAVLSLTSVIFILVFIWILHFSSNEESSFNQKMTLSLVSSEAKEMDLDKIIFILKQSCNFINLIRLDESKNSVEFHFNVEFSDLEKLNLFRENPYLLERNIHITMLDNHGLI